MTSRTIALITAVAVGTLLLCLAGPALLIGGTAAACVPAATTSGIARTGGLVGDWDAEQTANAQVIVTVGNQRGIPERGWIIAVATAMQESGLRNLPGGDRDSIGLFQQRPSQGWGSPAQLQTPSYAAGKFYDKLVTIPDWEQMPLTQAAQAVQVSAYPDAYAKWEDDATLLVTSVEGERGGCGAAGPGGWMMPIDGPIVSGFRTTERPGHDGIDIATPKDIPGA